MARAVGLTFPPRGRKDPFKCRTLVKDTLRHAITGTKGVSPTGAPCLASLGHLPPCFGGPRRARVPQEAVHLHRLWWDVF